MRILLDSCVSRRLASQLIGHEVWTTAEMGWADLDDGPLLNAMSGHFEVLVTVDKNLPKQQNLNNRPFAIIVLRAKTNRLDDLLPMLPALQAAINIIRPGRVCELKMP
jgi:predicted nuclease of predicted toxin-antitoxin system